MVKREYLRNASFSLNSIWKNLVLYLPDLAFFVGTFLLALLFLKINNLTSLLGGQLDTFSSQLRSISISGSLLFRLIVSFVVLIIVNVAFGISAVTLRLYMVRGIIRKEKVTLWKFWKDSQSYVMPVFWLKLCLFFIYLIPVIVLIGIGLLYQQLILIMILLVLIIFIMLKFVFLFSYATLLLKNLRNPITALQSTANYFNQNKGTVILVGVIVFAVNLIISGIISLAPIFWNSLNYTGIITVSIVLYILIKALVDITVNVWSNIFIFKNY